MDSRSSRRNSNFGRWVFVLISVFENASISPTTFCQQTLVNRSFVSCTEESRRNIYLRDINYSEAFLCILISTLLIVVVQVVVNAAKTASSTLRKMIVLRDNNYTGK